MLFLKPKYGQWLSRMSQMVLLSFIILTSCKPTAEQINSALITATPLPKLSTNTAEIQPVISTDTPINIVTNTATVVPAAIPTSTNIPPTNTVVVSIGCSDNLLDEPLHVEQTNDADEDWIDFSDQHILQDKAAIIVAYNLHGLMAQEGERKNDSTIVFTQRDSWFGVSLTKYGQNGLDGEQTARIPLQDFVELPNPDKGILGGDPLDLNAPISSLRVRFWYRDHFVVDITSIQLCGFE